MLIVNLVFLYSIFFFAPTHEWLRIHPKRQQHEVNENSNWFSILIFTFIHFIFSRHIVAKTLTKAASKSYCNARKFYFTHTVNMIE